MERKSEVIAIIIALVILIIGAILAVILNTLDIEESATLIAILLIPVIAYTIFSGRLLEFSGPGGWNAKFREAANKPVESLPISDCIQGIQMIEKLSVSDLKKQTANLDPKNPIALRIFVGTGFADPIQHSYSASALKAYIDGLSIFDPLLTIVLVDEQGRFIASALAPSLRKVLQGNEVSQFVDALKSANLTYLIEEAGFSRSSIDSGVSNVAALEKMRSENMLSMVVIDQNRLPVGIVRRDHIIALLVAKLASIN